MTSIAASFVIPTRFRDGQVLELLRSIQRQTVAAEVLVMDDAGSHELADVLSREFPSVRYYHLGSARGPAFQRNRGIELARAEFVFPLDDDTLLPSRRTAEQTLTDFSHPRIAAVAIPHVNVRTETRVRHQSPCMSAIWIAHAFTGASHAVRRSVFLANAGYREEFFYMGEEGDLCVRLLQRGYVVRTGTADPIHHLESPHRSTKTADYCGRRNDIYFAWQNVPARMLPLHLAGTTAKGLVSALRAPHPAAALRGIAAGFAGLMTRRAPRHPVDAGIYRLHRRLKLSGPLRLTEIETLLPALAEASA